jgi:outer membrane biosynthesis protein TonB
MEMSMKDGSDADWKSAWKGLPRPSPGPCPPSEAIAAFVSGTRDEGVLAHLSACAACREDVVAARADGDAPVPAALRLRLYRLVPGRRSLLPTLAVAAAILVAIAVGLILFWPTEQSAPPMARPKPAPAPKPEPSPAPAPPKPAPEPPGPAPRPEVPPAPEPPKPPAPAPTPAPEAPPPPKPAPEKPVAPPPAPEKPAPEPTRVALKGSVFAIAGSCASQVEGETLQALRVGQKRDFAGTLKLKAETAAAKVAVGSVTYYLQRGGELSLLLEEGRTRVQLARGEAFFDVTPGKGAFVVETALGTATVKGTRFLVSAEKAETEVVVQKGAVEFNAVALAAGERCAAGANRAASAPQKADLAKRLSWLRGLEDTILIEADQMALQGGMTVLADPTASAGRAIGAKAPLKPGQEAIAEIAARRKQAAPYAVWIRLHWGHGVPSAATLSVGDAVTWSSKSVVMSPAWQWVRVGTAELPDDRFRVRLTDTQGGLRVDQILITSDPELHPENK